MYPEIKKTQYELQNYINSVDSSSVENSLNKDKRQFSDFLNLISPAAGNLIASMRNISRKTRNKFFGKTVHLYTPLYLSNYCINDCKYCGFRSSSGEAERRRLSIDDALAEAEVIKSYGIDSVLLLSGEDPEFIDVDYLEKLVSVLKKYFSYISVEIYPMSTENYRRLFEAGVHGVTLYQETYQKELYKKLHKNGPKADYEQRLQFIENAGEAGMHNLGLGVLLGLYNWRVEMISLAAHALYLKRKFWKSRIQFSFPRITPANKNYKVPCPVLEAELEQMILAFRIFFRDSDIFISTRENVDFRNSITESSASHLSGASKVVPGAYCGISHSEVELRQFSLNDQRSVSQIDNELRNRGLEIVYKDWDKNFGNI